MLRVNVTVEKCKVNDAVNYTVKAKDANKTVVMAMVGIKERAEVKGYIDRIKKKYRVGKVMYMKGKK